MDSIDKCISEQAKCAEYIRKNPEGDVRGAKAGLADWIAEEAIERTSYEAFLESKRIVSRAAGFEPTLPLNPNLTHDEFRFQGDIVRWALRRGRAAIWAGTGMGKTGMELEWSRHVHHKTGKPVLNLCPLAVAEQTASEAVKFGIEGAAVHRNADNLTPISIVNYEMLQHFNPQDFGGIVLDECFPWDTKVGIFKDGKQSECYIKDVRIGDRMPNASGIDTVSDVHRRKVDAAVRLSVGGCKIVSSQNHPYFTQRGWVCAQDIEPGDAIMEAAAAMRMVRESRNSQSVTGSQEAILQSILLSEMADETAGALGESSQSDGGKKARGIGGRMVQGGIGRSTSKHAADAGHEANPGIARETVPHIESHEPQTFRSWWKRPWNDRAAADLDGCIARPVGAGVCLVTGATDSRVSNLLQAGLGEYRSQSRYRGGWVISPKQERPGPEERCQVGFVGVEGLEVLESGHPDLEKYRDADGFIYFYDIGGTRHPSFAVNGLLVHNSGILKSFEGSTRKAITEFCQHIDYRLSCTATPSPNDWVELGTQCEFLGIMSRTEMLATFFVHDGGQTSEWRLKKHAVEKFWGWVASWAVMITKPSDLGYPDGGFKLPPIEYHSIVVDAQWSSEFLFPVEASTLSERRKARRDSLQARVDACVELVCKSDEQWVVWCDLNDESKAIAKGIKDAVEVTGSDSREHKVQASLDFQSGEARVIVSKPSIYGWGLNWQHCRNVAFVGLSDSFEAMYQAVRRCWRFGQKQRVNVYVITSELEGAVVRNIKRKEQQDQEMRASMVEHMKDINAANIQSASRERTSYERDLKQSSDGWWAAHLGDSCEVLRELPAESVHYSIYSPPFASLYTYTNSDRDLGNSRDIEEFFTHYGFIVAETYRLLKPGRLVSFHCMNLPTSKERHGYIGIEDFRGELIRIHQRAGFIYHSEVCIWKDPVTAMQRTKALGLLHKQIKKDSCMSRQGIADYLVTMRKPGENPEPVSGAFEHYVGENLPDMKSPKMREEEGWKPLDADEFFEGPLSTSVVSGDRYSIEVWQRYASPVWMDINPSDTLQYRSAREQEDERHICPLQLQVIERGLDLWSNPGDVVLSPFMGIGSEGYVALQNGRRFIGCELKRSYWEQACRNLASVRVQGGLFSE